MRVAGSDSESHGRAHGGLPWAAPPSPGCRRLGAGRSQRQQSGITCAQGPAVNRNQWPGTADGESILRIPAGTIRRLLAAGAAKPPMILRNLERCLRLNAGGPHDSEARVAESSNPAPSRVILPRPAGRSSYLGPSRGRSATRRTTRTPTGPNPVYQLENGDIPCRSTMLRPSRSSDSAGPAFQTRDSGGRKERRYRPCRDHGIARAVITSVLPVFYH